jgi:hypothetical protein
MAKGLRAWVQEKWVDIGSKRKDGSYAPCGRSKGEKRKGYPKCVPLAKARSMSEGQRRSAVARKRAAGNTGPKPTNVSTFSKRKAMKDGGINYGEKYYKEERKRQDKFKKSEKDLDKRYKEIQEKEREFEYLNRLHPEDSTKEYNPVEFLKDGGLIKGKPRLAKRGWK